MDPSLNHKNQALGILTIGTAALGFGLFQVDFSMAHVLLAVGANVPVGNSGMLVVAKLVGVALAIFYYYVMFRGVARILQQTEEVTGTQLVQGPLFGFFMQIMLLIFIFVIDVFQTTAAGAE